jgi:alanine racemase
MLDVTGVEAGIGDVVTLVGGDGTELLDVATIADLAGASPYEILTGFHARLPRHYSGGE